MSGVVPFCLACFKHRLLLFFQIVIKLKSIYAEKDFPALLNQKQRMFKKAEPPHISNKHQPWLDPVKFYLTDKGT